MIPSAVSDKVTDTKLLASIIEKQEARIVEPWRTELEAFRVQNRNITETTLDELKTLAIDLAKNGSLSADEAMSLTYILFGSAEAHLFYANLLMTKKGIERIQFHNWFVAESSGEHFLRAYGAKIKNLTWPLFPPDKVFSAINLRLMLEHSSPHGGGDNMPSCYRLDPTGSGCPLPVLMDNQGHSYVELEPVENSFVGLQQRVQLLEKSLQNRGGSGRNQKQRYQPQHQLQQHQPPQQQRDVQQKRDGQPPPSYHPQHQQQQQFRGGHGRGRGSLRGGEADGQEMESRLF